MGHTANLLSAPSARSCVGYAPLLYLRKMGSYPKPPDGRPMVDGHLLSVRDCSRDEDVPWLVPDMPKPFWDRQDPCTVTCTSYRVQRRPGSVHQGSPYYYGHAQSDLGPSRERFLRLAYTTPGCWLLNRVRSRRIRQKRRGRNRKPTSRCLSGQFERHCESSRARSPRPRRHKTIAARVLRKRLTSVCVSSVERPVESVEFVVLETFRLGRAQKWIPSINAIGPVYRHVHVRLDRVYAIHLREPRRRVLFYPIYHFRTSLLFLRRIARIFIVSPGDYVDAACNKNDFCTYTYIYYKVGASELNRINSRKYT